MSTIDTSTFSTSARSYLDHKLATGRESPRDVIDQLLARAEAERLREATRVSALIAEALKEEPVPYDPTFFTDLRARIRRRAGVQEQ